MPNEVWCVCERERETRNEGGRKGGRERTLTSSNINVSLKQEKLYHALTLCSILFIKLQTTSDDFIQVFLLLRKKSLCDLTHLLRKILEQELENIDHIHLDIFRDIWTTQNTAEQIH